MKRINVLVISFFFPPAGGGGVLRIKTLVDRLKNKFNIFVITAKEELYPDLYKDKDINNIIVFRYGSFWEKILKKEIKNIFSKEKLQRNIFWYIKRWIRYALLIPDEKIFWVGRVLFSNHLYMKNIDVILATAPPYSNFLLGTLLSLIYRKPLILDYRDLWIDNKTYKLFFPGNIFSNMMEYMWLRRAVKIIFTTDKQKEKMIEHYNFIKNKSYVVYNGYDEKVFNNEEIKYPYKEGKRDFIKLVYTGSLTPYRNPECLFKAVNELPDDVKKIKIEFIGYFDPKHYDLIDKYELKDIVKIIQPVSQKEIARILREEADAFLLIQSKKEGGDTAIPGKLFEYLANEKPIIAIDDNGAVSDFLKNNKINQTVYITGFDYKDIRNSIINLVRNYNIVENKKISKLFTREKMANEMEVIISEIFR